MTDSITHFVIEATFNILILFFSADVDADFLQNLAIHGEQSQ